MVQRIKKIVLLGSGGLRIGQAGEFDYSGSQAIKAFREEGIHVVLINPNIATVQTDAGMADTVYLEPLDIETVTSIIKKEKPDAIALSFGGQTALNLGIALEKNNILKKNTVKVLGTAVSAIEITEDRDLFKKTLESIGVKTPKSEAAHSVKQAVSIAKRMGFPLMMRSGYSLGGLGSGKIESEKELLLRAAQALHHAPQILLEEYLGGWKEIEYEIVRDESDNAIAVCNMENLDPMGIHTGESIVVAPSQTLNNQEYHMLREISLKVARHIGIIGECNIQFALDPHSLEYRVIEMNARLSRSSALASKATGYPLAYVAAKLQLGKKLFEIANSVTKKTTAFFEPALDYVVVKMPRWDMHKFKDAQRIIGSEMKSVGEVMAIGRSFPEALQKAIRMTNIGATGFQDYPYQIEDPVDEVIHPTFRRLFALRLLLQKGKSVSFLHRISHIDPWFLFHLKQITDFEKTLRQLKKLSSENILRAKKLGFSDTAIAKIRNTSAQNIRKARIRFGITPWIKQIDTLAGEFPAKTNYLYTTYHASSHDIVPSEKKSILVLGSGPYCIGSSVEFDWCAVNMVRSLKKQGEHPIVINSNPETVSTDYDESERLYFEELTLERVEDIADFESLKGIVVSVGGQIANNLALPLSEAGYPVLGTSPQNIDMAENRYHFSELLTKLSIEQPLWKQVTNLSQAKKFAEQVGYPILVRPSYVLSGAAMNVIYQEKDLAKYLYEASIVSREHPVVLTSFITNAKEFDIDGVAYKGKVVIDATSEHIENAGVHSGDATLVLPAQTLSAELIEKARCITERVIQSLSISGPFNLQFIAKGNDLKVIECNVRASRSFPFVSKVTNHNFIEIATKVLLKTWTSKKYETYQLNHIGVKTSQFSYNRIKGFDPVSGVEMSSTGEVACIGKDFFETLYRSWCATEQKIEQKSIFVQIQDNSKDEFDKIISVLQNKGWKIYQKKGGHHLLKDKKVGIAIILPNPIVQKDLEGKQLRRLAIDHHIPLFTNTQTALVFLKALSLVYGKRKPVKSWQEYSLSLKK